MDCSICCELINKTIRRPIVCCYCNYKVCLACTKRYLLDSFHQPHCMECRREWSHSYLIKQLGPFMKNEYRAKRELLLFEKEKTFIPELLPIAEREKKLDCMTQHINTTQRDLMEWYKEYGNHTHNEWIRVKRDIKRTVRALLDDRYALSNTDVRNERKVFTMKCTVPDCRGFLSTRYKCGLCSTTICSSCHAVSDDEHKCDPDMVATITELKKSTKPCPSCHCPIYKSEGCDQMWCIQCHTAFSWRTGQVEKGIIHNPHYFEFIKERGELPRNPLDIPCGGLPDYRSIYIYMMDFGLGIEEITYLRQLYENISHHREVTMRFMPNEQEQVNHHDVILEYILHRITETQCKATLYVHEQKRLRGLEERQMLEAYLAICEEAFRKLIQHHVTFEEFLHEIEEIKIYTRREVTQLGQRYQHVGFFKPTDI